MHLITNVRPPRVCAECRETGLKVARACDVIVGAVVVGVVVVGCWRWFHCNECERESCVCVRYTFSFLLICHDKLCPRFWLVLVLDGGGLNDFYGA